jgi:hypothetical protein
LLEELRGPRDIGEEQRDRSCRQGVIHGLSCTGCLFCGLLSQVVCQRRTSF